MSIENIIPVMDYDIPELSVYTGLNEKQLKTYYEPAPGLFICESEKVIRRALSAGYEAESFFAEEGKVSTVEDILKTRGFSVPVYVAPSDVMKKITGYSLTGGILCAMRRRTLPDPGEIIRAHEKIVILDDVENPTNIGAIFRSAAALGAGAVLLTEGSSDPLYRRAARVSMGTVFQIPWTFIDKSFVKEMKSEGFYTMALALTSTAIPISDIDRSRLKRAVILGNEDGGISKEILEMSDAAVIIPMYHEVDSLNVAAASAVAFWELFRNLP